MRQDGDRMGDTTGDSTARLTVRDAADVMGISAEAVRQRIKRGTLPTEKDHDGTVRVLMDADRMRTNDRPDDRTDADRMRTDGRTDADSTRTNDRTDGDGTADQALLMAYLEHLEQEVEFLQAELRRREEDHQEETRRKDTLLMTLMHRVPELEAPRNGHETTPVAPDREAPRPATEGPQGSPEPRSERSRWRRWFGFE